nr:hypothetical protein CFP56_37231 [Quercus suber]
MEDKLEKGNGYLSQPEPELKRSSTGFGPLSLLSILRPSFLSRAGPRNQKLRKTAYLDGVRGFASVMVYLLHHLLWSHENHMADRKLETAWGYNDEYYLGAFPIIRNFFTGGHYAVATFFVISGYVLSAKPLALIQAREYDKLAENVASALFRRWLRLFLPIIAVTLVVVVMWHWFGLLANFVPERNLVDELWRWYRDFKSITWIFRSGGDPWFRYNPHTWSIPLEFKGSIAVYTAAIAFSRCTRNARLLCEIGLWFYFMYIADGAHYAMFIGGMFICDIDLLAAREDLPNWLYRFKPQKTMLMYLAFFASLVLGGCPSWDAHEDGLKKSPGWRYLFFMKPQAVFDYKWFFLFWASFFIILSVPHISWAKGFFETRFNQYLGRISYMFYLVHGPILWTLGDRLYAATGWVRENQALALPGWPGRFPLPTIGPFGLEISYIVPQLFLLPFTIWVADIATTVIDDNSIKFAAWLYSLTKPSPAAKLPQQERRSAD